MSIKVEVKYGWNEDELEKLRLYIKDFSSKEIAQKLNRPLEEVRRVIAQLRDRFPDIFCRIKYKVTCKKCGNVWEVYSKHPRACPNCNSSLWEIGIAKKHHRTKFKNILGSLGDGLETKRGYEIGKTSSLEYVKRICIKCGREDWVASVKYVQHKFRDVCRKCYLSSYNKRENNNNWHGGRLVGRGGYVQVLISKDNPYFSMTTRRNRSKSSGYVLEHRLIMAQYLHRCLLAWEVVHHKNGIRTDNRLDNLELIKGKHNHACYNMLQREMKKLAKENEELKRLVVSYQNKYGTLELKDAG